MCGYVKYRTLYSGLMYDDYDIIMIDKKLCTGRSLSMSKLKNVMVCVTQQKNCERLIMAGYERITKDKDNLFVINVVNEKDNFLHTSTDGEALEYLFGVSSTVGASLTVIRAKDVIAAMGEFAKENKITHIVLGASPHGGGEDDHPIAKRLKDIVPKSEFIIV